MKYPCVESTLEVTIGDKMVRLWINQTEVPSVLPAYRVLVGEIKRRVMTTKIQDFMDWLGTYPNINAAALLRTDPRDGNSQLGVVVYYVPFAEGPRA